MAFRPYTPKPITDLFTPNDTSINRRECRRTRPMKVLALGLGRTGTASLREALKQLGFNDCYHMMSASVENPPDCLMWSDALAAKYDGQGTVTREHWDQLFGHCQAICDWPCVAFAKELVAAYPEAKVILTNRDVDSWYASTLKTVHWRATEPGLKMAAKFDWAASMYQPMLAKFWDCFWEGDFEKNGKRRFAEYYAEVRSCVPAHNLLEYKVGEGWDRLCTFLDVPVPAGVKFPKTNDTDGFVARCQHRNRMQLLNGLTRMTLMVGVLVTLLYVAWSLITSLAGRLL